MDFPDLNFNEENNYLTEFFGSTMNQPLIANPPRIISPESHVVTYNEHETSEEKSNQNNVGVTDDGNKKSIGQMSEYESYRGHRGHHHHQYGHEERTPVAVLSYHRHKYVEVPDHPVHYKPTVIDLDGKRYPIRLQFNSHSSPLVRLHHNLKFLFQFLI